MTGAIKAGLDALGLAGKVPEQAPAQLARYCGLLLEKNQVMNLTAITDPAQVVSLHILDCAALAALAPLEGGKSLIDVGTGAGFPGLVLKILTPSLEVTLADSLKKRLDWLDEVIGALGLRGVRTLHGRGEELAHLPEYRQQFDFAAARAVADLRVLSELCLPFVREGGQFLAMKSTGSDGEIAAAGKAIALLGGAQPHWVDYPVPGAGVTHRLAIIQKTGETPEKNPRRWAKMTKSPL